MKKKLPKKIEVNAIITGSGIDIIVNGDRFPVIYPKNIWKAYAPDLKEILKDNIAYGATIFLPQMINLPKISYKTSRPLSESFFFKNGIYDMPICAGTDGKSSMDYIRLFFNTYCHFKGQEIKMPNFIQFKAKSRKRQTAIIPFSFGKESMLSFALCQELGIRPILVNFIEPANRHEYFHKKQMIQSFEKVSGVKVHTVMYNPGFLRYGHYFDLNTELGWGLQTTEYALLCLPFAHYFNADYIVLGNEESCNDMYLNRENILTYKAGYDQHQDWTKQQGVLVSLMAGRKIDVISFMQPLYEIAITYILHSRYPQYRKFQMSCMADKPEASKNRWCQHCVKCGYIYALCAAAGLDLEEIGFTENLFDSPHTAIYDHFFHYDPLAPVYGSQEELGLAFYLAYKKGYKGKSMERFKKQLLPLFKNKRKDFFHHYFGLHSSFNIPPVFRPIVKRIFQRQLNKFISD